MTPSGSITQPWTASRVDVTAAISAGSQQRRRTLPVFAVEIEHDAERLTEPGERIKEPRGESCRRSPRGRSGMAARA
jgi:hypothetical protein